ncbi:MAG TPA: hypothetical protein VFB21_25050 [Chthonomonadaceae bacterium]|nr:hypothetical protein [Chthonomonadaceae bacterium]
MKTRRATLFCLIACLGALAWLLHANSASRADTPVLEPAHATWQAPSAAPDAEPPVPMPLVQVEADATQTVPADPAAEQKALRPLLAGASLPAASAEAPPAPAGPIPLNSPHFQGETASAAWFFWGRLGATRVRAEAQTPDPALTTDLGVYAVRSEEGATVCLANLSDRKIKTQVRIRLPRGLYRIERLTLSAPPRIVRAAGTSGQTARLTFQETPPDAETGLEHRLNGRLEGLEGRDLARTAAIVKLGAMEPGQVCLLRYTDQAAAVSLALREVRRQLNALAASAPGPARRLRRILKEGDPYSGDLRAGRGRDSSRVKRLGRIHHLLLLIAQAHSLHHNYQARGTVGSEAGAAVMGALERLTDALAQASATLLGLVPQVAVVPSGAPAAPENGGSGKTERRVSVALANTGAQSVGMVKIGLDVSALPPGVECTPSDPAFFGTLRPGQTVRAVFRLRAPATTEIPDNRCVGDISYFAASVPAHLRPRPW